MTPKPLVLRDKFKEATAQEIMNAAEAELAEHGLANTSISAIANRAGVSVGTIYNYFKDKEVLLSTLIAERRQQFGVHFEKAMETHKALPFERHLEEIVNAVFEIFETQRNFLRIILENEKPMGVKGVRAKRPLLQFIDRFRPLADKGVESGLLSPQDADLYASALAALIRSVMIERLNDTTRPFKDATPFVLRMFLDGARRRS